VTIVDNERLSMRWNHLLTHLAITITLRWNHLLTHLAITIHALTYTHKPTTPL
jgi:hypothetical protein